MSTLVIVLRIVSLLAFAGLMSLAVTGRCEGAKTRARQSGSDRVPLVANLAAFGVYLPSLLIFSRSAVGSTALLLASSGSLLAVAGAALVLRSRAELGPAWSFRFYGRTGSGLNSSGVTAGADAGAKGLLRSAASKHAEACCRVRANRCPYTSNVTRMLECPIVSEMYFAPWAMSSDAY
jgi:hypothetical protein